MATWAGSQQEHEDVCDSVLLAFARDRHPTVAWWWGRRLDQGRQVAYCYLCDSVICGVAARASLNREQRQEVMNHRSIHIHIHCKESTPTDRSVTS